MSLALAKTASILGIPTVLTSSQEDRLQGPLLPEFKNILPEAFEKRVSAKASSTPGPMRTSRRLWRRRGGKI